MPISDFHTIGDVVTMRYANRFHSGIGMFHRLFLLQGKVPSSTKTAIPDFLMISQWPWVGCLGIFVPAGERFVKSYFRLKSFPQWVRRWNENFSGLSPVSPPTLFFRQTIRATPAPGEPRHALRFCFGAIWTAILPAVWPAREIRHLFHLEIEDIFHHT